MTTLRLAAPLSIALLACACSQSPEAPATNDADDFAARIKSGKSSGAAPVVEGGVAPKVAPPRENAAEGAFSPGSATDPQSRCGANLLAEFLGQRASDAVRGQIMDKATASDIRFIAPGSGFIRGDPTHPRLNIMIATDGVIRDIRCG